MTRYAANFELAYEKDGDADLDEKERQSYSCRYLMGNLDAYFQRPFSSRSASPSFEKIDITVLHTCKLKVYLGRGAGRLTTNMK